MNRQKQYLAAMGIDLWVRRDMPQPAPETEPSAAESSDQDSAQQAGSATTSVWQQLTDSIEQCQRCDLSKTRQQSLIGWGNLSPKWMVVIGPAGDGENPLDTPFSGISGQLLTNMLRAAGTTPEQIYITRLIKCAPTHADSKIEQSVQQCSPFLEQQIQQLKPALILCLGKLSAQHLIGSNEKISDLRGQVHRYGEQQIPLIVSYNPTYLLRKPTEKRQAWLDLKLALTQASPVIEGS